MIVLEPISKRRIWGTNRLHDYSGNKHIDKIGSVYSVSGTKEISNLILNGEFKGQRLNELVEQFPEYLGLEKGGEYPLIISITGADADLSIQVHPTDDYAQKQESSLYGKNESWYFLEAPEKGWIYSGSKSKDKVYINEKMHKGAYQDIIDTCEVEQYDYVFIPSGTLHALTAGSLVYEIQQSTDITYRFYDYNRTDVNGDKRKLHTEKAIETLQPSQSVEKSALIPEKVKHEKPYSIIYKSLIGDYMNSNKIAQALTVIDGELIIDNFELQKGSSVLILPDEKVTIQQLAQVIIATPNIYW
ncbi:type I phosphomannose isomerase catalytic subunit [Amphibacillus sp. Q70]|uniref:type I phosphomannose isomerase catalytic subunit n=1 Tax=Amphibacillus sp. Q70 TaxID=3453416 RepID=UPI003F87E91D